MHSVSKHMRLSEYVMKNWMKIDQHFPLYPDDSSFWKYKVYVDIRWDSLKTSRQTTVG